MSVKDVKVMIEDKEGVPVENQKLSANGKRLEDDMSLAESGVIEATTITLHFELKGGAGKEKTIFVLDENDFDHSFDWDFSHRRYTNSNKIFYRRNREYIRPHGWVRIGLNVKDKYPDMAWIGGRKRPSKYESAEGEMAVSFV